jgi:TRAP-type C4-dicarboxylate transport system permease small subunit
LADTVVAAALVGEPLAVLAHAIARAFFHNSFLWSDEIARFALSILAFIGGAARIQLRLSACG